MCYLQVLWGVVSRLATGRACPIFSSSSELCLSVGSPQFVRPVLGNETGELDFLAAWECYAEYSIRTGGFKTNETRDAPGSIRSKEESIRYLQVLWGVVSRLATGRACPFFFKFE